MPMPVSTKSLPRFAALIRAAGAAYRRAEERRRHPQLASDVPDRGRRTLDFDYEDYY